MEKDIPMFLVALYHLTVFSEPGNQKRLKKSEAVFYWLSSIFNSFSCQTILVCFKVKYKILNCKYMEKIIPISCALSILNDKFLVLCHLYD